MQHLEISGNCIRDTLDNTSLVLTNFARSKLRLCLFLALFSKDLKVYDFLSAETRKTRSKDDSKAPSSKQGVKSKSRIVETGHHPSRSLQRYLPAVGGSGCALKRINVG